MTHEAAHSKPIVLTGMQPTKALHLGNYLGALRQWLPLLDNHECFFLIVDMHAITVAQTPADLRHNTLSCLAQYIACGLDPEKCHIFVQSHIVGHTELAWVLGSLCSIGQLQRMTQFKDKSVQQESKGLIGAGLLYYPILQAADILLYNADLVPVGEDQKQHLELTRDLAERFNGQFSATFKVPEVMIAKTAARVMSLQDPTKKMSKSDPNAQSTLFLLDDPKVLKKKIMSAVTDTGRDIIARVDKPGMTNLLGILSALTGKTVHALEKSFEGQGYGDFKGQLADEVIALCEPIQKRYHELMADKAYLETVLAKSAQAAQHRADKVLAKVYRKIGFLSK
ncbi:MAG: tryptophan--tRNA ligase [Verrucomicrobia bacterium 21-51-4]|nr:MAG: tryptophan--tRNA ligase [Verrucomicrobia bacterium 21-51-4]HQU09149.1 tryptophan--tRNA ligase [Opitutales bacterium]